MKPGLHLPNRLLTVGGDSLANGKVASRSSDTSGSLGKSSPPCVATDLQLLAAKQTLAAAQTTSKQRSLLVDFLYAYAPPITHNSSERVECL